MADDKKEDKSSENCGRRCGGCKFLAGVLAGLLVAGTGFGLFMAGRCSRHGCHGGGHAMCPYMDQQSAQPTK